MGVKIPTWQATILYHIEEGTVMNGNPSTHNGSTVINLDKLHIEGEVRMGGHALDLRRNSIDISAPASLALSLTGKPLSALIAIPPTGIEQIDRALPETRIECCEKLAPEDGKPDDRYRFELTSPELDLEKIKEERTRNKS